MDKFDFRFENFRIRCNFLQKLELRITFASCRKFMTYEFYIKQPMPMCEIKLNQHLARKPELLRLFGRYKVYTYLQKYAHKQAD